MLVRLLVKIVFVEMCALKPSGSSWQYTFSLSKEILSISEVGGKKGRKFFPFPLFISRVEKARIHPCCLFFPVGSLNLFFFFLGDSKRFR